MAHKSRTHDSSARRESYEQTKHRHKKHHAGETVPAETPPAQDVPPPVVLNQWSELRPVRKGYFCSRYITYDEALYLKSNTTETVEYDAAAGWVHYKFYRPHEVVFQDEVMAQQPQYYPPTERVDAQQETVAQQTYVHRNPAATGATEEHRAHSRGTPSESTASSNSSGKYHLVTRFVEEPDSKKSRSRGSSSKRHGHAEKAVRVEAESERRRRDREERYWDLDARDRYWQ